MTADGRIMTVSIHLGSDGGIEAGQPQMLFQTRPRSQELESLRRDAGRPAFLGQYSPGMDQRGPDYGGHELD
jgi:hypothetical protein